MLPYFYGLTMRFNEFAPSNIPDRGDGDDDFRMGWDEILNYFAQMLVFTHLGWRLDAKSSSRAVFTKGPATFVIEQRSSPSIFFYKLHDGQRVTMSGFAHSIWTSVQGLFQRLQQQSLKEGYQDFNKVEPYAVCLAGKPVKTFDYYEDARRFHDNWKKKLYNQGDKAKADKITLMPIMKEFAPSPGYGDDDNWGSDVPRDLHQFANLWWNAADPEMQKYIEDQLATGGWSIQQVESEDDAVQLQHREGTVYYISANEFDPDLNEETGDTSFDNMMRRIVNVDPSTRSQVMSYANIMCDFYNINPEQLTVPMLKKIAVNSHTDVNTVAFMLGRKI